MSTVRTDNFGPSAGGTTYSARGIAKAWVNFNGTGTIAARDSENVSSLTDNGTGSYTVSFTNAFGAADFSAPCSSVYDVSGTRFANRFYGTYAISASSCRAVASDSVGNGLDMNDYYISMFGDLA